MTDAAHEALLKIAASEPDGLPFYQPGTRRQAIHGSTLETLKGYVRGQGYVAPCLVRATLTDQTVKHRNGLVRSWRVIDRYHLTDAGRAAVRDLTAVD